MKKNLFLLAGILLMTACGNNEKQLRERAAELCEYIPDHELKEGSRDYMTEDFYNVLDTMFNYLPEFEAMDHEWLYYFVTGNGGTIADCKIDFIEQTDKTHAVAHINAFQKWSDSGFYEPDDMGEPHRLYMEKVNGVWLMSDFDEHKADCIRHIAISHDEQARRDAIGSYLVNEIGSQYLRGEICVPTISIINYELADSAYYPTLCDCWVMWYNLSGDTLKCVSGGNHSGLIALEGEGHYTVTSFEQTVDGAGHEASAKRIFGTYYDIYQNVHSNEAVREAVRKEQLREYVKRHNLKVNYYQDYGWPAVEL